MRPVELFEGELQLVDIFAGFVAAKIDTDWDRPSVPSMPEGRRC